MWSACTRNGARRLRRRVGAANVVSAVGQSIADGFRRSRCLARTPCSVARNRAVHRLNLVIGGFYRENKNLEGPESFILRRVRNRKAAAPPQPPKQGRR